MSPLASHHLRPPISSEILISLQNPHLSLGSLPPLNPHHFQNPDPKVRCDCSSLKTRPPPNTSRSCITSGFPITCRMPATRNTGVSTSSWIPHHLQNAHHPTTPRDPACPQVSHHLLKSCITSKNPFPLGFPPCLGCPSRVPQIVSGLLPLLDHLAPSSFQHSGRSRCKPLTRWLPRRQQPG